jgi:colanic acid/amylovoran biosynthesis glycosyltransferase
LLRHAPAVVHYLASLQAVRGVRRVKSLAFVAAALRLRRIAAQRHFDHVFAHSCADAAHAIALSRVLGGPPYSLRLGGDLEVYGGDHRQKMARATLIVPAARAYEPRLVDEVGVAPERVMWSWVGTDTERFAPGPARPKGGPLQLVTVARLNPAKGYQVMIPALARLRAAGVPFRYRIVGAGPYEAAIREAIAAHQLHDAVELLGSQSAEHIAGLLAASDVFVLPTNGLGEGTPAAVCEAMSAGVAVVATAVGGIADMIDDGVHGRIVPPGDEAALAAALQQLAGDRAALARMASACRTKALAQFDCRAVARRILDKIASLPVNPR